jgi:hypothetical protein
MAAAFSPIMIDAAFVLPGTIRGMIEASATRSLSIPCICGKELFEAAIGESGRFGRGPQLEVTRAMEIIGWRWNADEKIKFKDYGRQKYYQRPVADMERKIAEARQMNIDAGFDFPDTDAEDLV